jgi:hypothetical protein
MLGGVIALYAAFMLYKYGVYGFNQFDPSIDDSEIFLVQVMAYAFLLVLGIHIIRSGVDDW